MTEQESLNDFVCDLKEVFKLISLKDSGINEMSVCKIEDYCKFLINGDSSDEIFVSSDSFELTIGFGESHWHINSYSNPLHIDRMKIECIIEILDIINVKTITYSAWCGDRCLGGAKIKYGDGIRCNDDIVERAEKSFPMATELRIKVFGYEKEVIFLERTA